MAAIATPTTDKAIRRAAIDRLGVADASVVRQAVHGEHSIDGGVWFVLSVKRTAASEWEVIGRRRTKAELWAWLQNPRCQESA